MASFLQDFVAIMLLVVVLGYFNEKITKLTDEIALMLFAGSCHMRIRDFH